FTDQSPTFTPTTYIFGIPSAYPAPQAISFPSGDQAGSLKYSGYLITAICFSRMPSASALNRADSRRSSKVRRETNCDPSGENETFVSTPSSTLPTGPPKTD